jgi:hypothetical protein
MAPFFFALFFYFVRFSLAKVWGIAMMYSVKGNGLNETEERKMNEAKKTIEARDWKETMLKQYGRRMTNSKGCTHTIHVDGALFGSTRPEGVEEILKGLEEMQGATVTPGDVIGIISGGIVRKYDVYADSIGPAVSSLTAHYEGLTPMVVIRPNETLHLIALDGRDEGAVALRRIANDWYVLEEVSA